MQEGIFTHLHDAYITDDVKAGLRELMGNPELCERLGRNIGRLPVVDFDDRADRMLEIIESEAARVRNEGGKPGG